jgi:micrococcal nuclease
MIPTLHHYRAKIERIIDGDTIDVMIDCGFSMWTKQRLRLLHIDTPERNEPGYADAKAKLFELVMDFSLIEPDKVAWQPLIVHTIKRDSFGRWLATVWTEGSEKSLNQSMIEFGYPAKTK